MSTTITINPVTRISGFLEIRVEVEENQIIRSEASGLLFRGFEKMLRGRVPTDAIYFTERICGICSAAHGIASALAIENALDLPVTLNDNYIRDLIHGFEFIQNHIRHFYLMTIPSFVRITGVSTTPEQENSDYRLPEEINNRMVEHYISSIEYSRLAHEGLAVLGGKAPHNHGIFAGGVTVIPDAYKLEKVKSILIKIQAFVATAMREDVEILARYYSDYFNMGISYPNFMTFGIFNQYDDPEITYVKAGVRMDGMLYPFVSSNITEQIRYAWYIIDQAGEEVDLSKPDAYSFIKSPSYAGFPMEVGPLARLIVRGDYTRGHSCMDRIIARVLETEIILEKMNLIVNRVNLLPNNQKVIEFPQQALGAGLVDTTRGALGHWIQIENQVIHHYNIITPTVWNLSPRYESGIPGVVENALLGTMIENIDEPIEIGRIVRSFDPCVSCATHVIGPAGKINSVEVLV